MARVDEPGSPRCVQPLAKDGMCFGMMEMHSLHCYMFISNCNLSRKTHVARGGVKLPAIDLNLLVVFDAVMRERNVTRASRRVGLSQPATSHALTRLRYMLKDDLFIRSPKGMVPTPRAEQSALPIREALDTLQRSLEPTQFDPSTASGRFRIAVDNYAAIVLVGPMVARIARIAPALSLEFLPSGTLDIVDLLDRGELDLAIGSFPEQGERFSHELLLQDEFVAVLRRNHPATRSRELSIEKFAGLPHLEISSVRHATDFIDEALMQRKLSRRMRCARPSYLRCAFWVRRIWLPYFHSASREN
jgi:DNA-binding transcriptional LysR family regulator